MQIKLQPLQLVNVYQRAINQFMRGRAWTPNDTARALREATSHTYLSNTPNSRKPCPPVTLEVSAFGGIQASESVQAGQSGQPQPMPPQPQAQGPQPPNPSAPQKPVAPAGEASQTALIAFIDELQTMAGLPEGSPERDQAEQRADMLWEMIRNGDDDGEGQGEEDDNGEQTAALKEALSRVPFDVFTHVYHLDNGPWQPFKGPRGGIGWKNSQTGRVLYTNATEAPGSRRRTQQASGERAKVIGDRVMSHYQNPEEHHAPDENELQELATHLPKMTAQHLQQLRGRLMASFKHGKRQSQMVEALKAHVDHLVKNKQEHGALFPEAQKGAAIADAKEEAQAAKSPKPGTVKMLSTDEMHVDPERFQFKQNVNKEGVTDELKGVQTFNPDLAGIISVWHDPKDGKTYVVNGHHRAELAKRTGHPHLAVRYINAPNATEARAKGALINIAEGRGTAVDAAKFMRDMDLNPEDLATHGISLKGALARDAGHLRGLADALFSKVARGQMDTDRAVAIGKHLNGKEDLQLQLANFIDKKEEQTGREWTPKMVAEAAEEVAHAPTTTKDDGGLFGGTTEESRLEERAALKSHVRGELAKAQRDFEAVASDRRAGAVKDAGNVLNVEENKKHAQQHAQDAEVFAKLAHYKGPMSDLINEYAEQYANVPKSKRRQIEADLVGQVRDLIHRGGATGSGDQGGGVVSEGSAGTTGTGALPTERGELPNSEGGTTEGDNSNVVGPVHGQPHTATVYRGESKSGSGAGLSALGAGKYYGLNEGVANRFSKSGTVQQQSVSLKNPIVLHSDEDMEKIKQQAEEETGLDFGKKGRMYSGMLLGDQPAAFTKWAKSKGYDGLITTYKEAPGGEQLLSFDDPASPTETPTANDETTAPAEDKPTIVGTGKTDDGGEVHFVPHSKQSDDETTIMVDPKKFDAAHRESDALAVHPDGKNEVKGKREDIRNGMEKGGPMESPRATLDADGKPSVTDGRHRTRELTDMGLSHMGLTVPKEQAAEFQKRYGVTDGSEPQPQEQQTATDQSEGSASAKARQEGQGDAKPKEEPKANDTDWKDTAAQYRHGGSATAGEAAHLKHTYDGLGEADRKEFAHHFGIDNAHKALPETRDELVNRKIRELEFRGAKEVPDVHDGNLFTERGVGEKRSLFDDDGKAADAGLVNDPETTPETTPTTAARSAADSEEGRTVGSWKGVKEHDGHLVAPGKFLAKGKFTTINEQGEMVSGYHDTPEEAVTAHKEQQEREKTGQAKHEAREALKSKDTLTHEEAKTLARGETVTKGQAVGLLRELKGITKAEAEKIVNKTRYLDETSGGAIIYHAHDILQRAGKTIAKPDAEDLTDKAVDSTDKPVKVEASPTKDETMKDAATGSNEAVWLNPKPMSDRSLGDISGLQRSRMSGREQNKFDAEQDNKAERAGNERRGWIGQVLQSYDAGEFNLNTPGVHGDVRRVVERHLEAKDDQQKQEILRKTTEANYPAKEDVKVGDTYHVAGTNGYYTISKLNGATAKVKSKEFGNERNIPYAELRHLRDDHVQDAANAGLSPKEHAEKIHANPDPKTPPAADGPTTQPVEAATKEKDLTDKAVDFTDQSVKLNPSPTTEDSVVNQEDALETPTDSQGAIPPKTPTPQLQSLRGTEKQRTAATDIRQQVLDKLGRIEPDQLQAKDGMNFTAQHAELMKTIGEHKRLKDADFWLDRRRNSLSQWANDIGNSVLIDDDNHHGFTDLSYHFDHLPERKKDDRDQGDGVRNPTTPKPPTGGKNDQTPPTPTVETDPTPTSTTTQEGQQATVTDQSPAPVPEAKDETPTTPKRKATKASTTPQEPKPLSKAAAKSYATQLHHHWQQHQAGDVAHGKHYADALANLQQLPATDQDAVFAHADKLSGVNHRQPATPDAKAEAPKPAKTWDEGNDKHVAELLDRAYGHRRMFAENRDGLVEVPLLYHEMKKHMPDLSVARFHQELRKYQQHGNGGELHVLNEVHSAVDPHLALQGGDASDPRLYYYLRQHHNDGDILAPDAKPER